MAPLPSLRVKQVPTHAVDRRELLVVGAQQSRGDMPPPRRKERVGSLKALDPHDAARLGFQIDDHTAFVRRWCRAEWRHGCESDPPVLAPTRNADRAVFRLKSACLYGFSRDAQCLVGGYADGLGSTSIKCSAAWRDCWLRWRARNHDC